MVIDSVLLYGLVKELKPALTFAQVRQIHQTDARVFDLELYRPSSQAVHLLLNLQKPLSLYLSGKSGKESQYIASQNFCMTLRKHLEGSRLSSIEQVQMDRIVCLAFDRIETDGKIITKKLYAELIPSAPNLILTENGRILDALVRGKKQHRTLSFGSGYALPDGTQRLDFMQFNAGELSDLFRFGKQQDGSVQDFLYHTFNGFSAQLLRTLWKEAGIPGETALSELSEDGILRLSGAIFRLAAAVRDAGEFYVSGEPGKETISLLPPDTPNAVPIPSLSSWLSKNSRDQGSIISASIQELQKHIRSLLKKEERKIRKIQDEMAETSQLAQYKLWGNLLSIYAYMKVPGQTSITVDNPFDENGGKETIPLLPELDLIRNGQAYFKRYSKMKTRLAIGQEKLNECLIRLEYLRNADYFAGEIRDRQSLEALRQELTASVHLKIQKQPSKKSKPARSHGAEEPVSCCMVEGYPVWIGRNNRQNEYLTLKKAAKTDLWLHAQKIPGSHVVIEGSHIPESVITAAASYAAWFSQGKESGKVPVDYTLVRHVKKIKNGPAGLVTYTHQKTIVAAPQKPDSLL